MFHSDLEGVGSPCIQATPKSTKLLVLKEIHRGPSKRQQTIHLICVQIKFLLISISADDVLGIERLIYLTLPKGGGFISPHKNKNKIYSTFFSV